MNKITKEYVDGLGRDGKFLFKLVMKQFEIIGKKDKFFEEINIDEWYRRNTMDEKQHKKWRTWAIKQIMKHSKMREKGASESFAWLDLCYGLRVVDGK